MMNAKPFLLALGLILATLAATPGQAAGTSTGGTSCGGQFLNTAMHQGVLNINNVIGGGDNEYCSYLRSDPRYTNQVIEYSAHYSGPSVLALGGATMVWSNPEALVGCTVSGFTTHADQLAADSGATTYARITMTSDYCRGAFEFKITITVAAVILYQWDVFDAINIQVEAPPFTHLCAATEATAASYTPAQTCQEPQINNLNYLCAATAGTPDSFSETATTCNTPTINAALSGTINAVLSGAIALSGTLTVSDDAGGWAIHQDPISGELTICPEEAPCFAEVSGININNISVNATIGSEFEVRNATSDFFVPILLWLTAMVIFLRHHKMLSAAVCALGAIIACFSLPFSVHAIAIGALLVALWLEATARDKIITRFFSPSTEP